MKKGQYTLKPSVYFHPGEELEDKLQEMGMSIDEFAKLSMVPCNIVRCIIKGEVSVTPDIACAFEEVTKIPARVWINMQHNYDDYILEKQRSSWSERLRDFSQRVASVLI